MQAPYRWPELISWQQIWVSGTSILLKSMTLLQVRFAAAPVHTRSSIFRRRADSSAGRRVQAHFSPDRGPASRAVGKIGEAESSAERPIWFTWDTPPTEVVEALCERHIGA